MSSASGAQPSAHARHGSQRASAGRRLQHCLTAPTLPMLLVLNLDKPREREAHDFLVQVTSKRGRIWWLIDLGR